MGDEAEGKDQPGSNPNDQGGGSDEHKGDLGDKPTVESLLKRVETLESEKKQAEKEAVKRKKALREQEEQKRKQEEESLATQKQFKELADRRGERVKALEDRVRNRAIENELQKHAVSMGLADMDLLKLVPREGIHYDDESDKVHGAKDALEIFKETKPQFFGKKKVPATQRGNEGPGFEADGFRELSQEEIAKLPHKERAAYYRKLRQLKKEAAGR